MDEVVRTFGGQGACKALARLSENVRVVDFKPAPTEEGKTVTGNKLPLGEVYVDQYVEFLLGLSENARQDVLQISKRRLREALVPVDGLGRWRFVKFMYRFLDGDGGHRAELPCLLSPAKLMQLTHSESLVNLLQFSFKEDTVVLSDSLIRDKALLTTFLRESLDLLRGISDEEESGGSRGGDSGPGPEDLNQSARSVWLAHTFCTLKHFRVLGFKSASTKLNTQYIRHKQTPVTPLNFFNWVLEMPPAPYPIRKRFKRTKASNLRRQTFDVKPYAIGNWSSGSLGKRNACAGASLIRRQQLRRRHANWGRSRRFGRRTCSRYTCPSPAFTI
jgi:hypothetical protein